MYPDIWQDTFWWSAINQFYCHCVLAEMALGALWWQTVTNPPSYHSHPWSVCTFQYNPTSSAVVPWGWMFRGSCQACLHDLDLLHQPFNPAQPPPLKPIHPSRHSKDYWKNIIFWILVHEKVQSPYYLMDVWSWYCKNISLAINATSLLIDFVYLGKYECLGKQNEREMFPHTTRVCTGKTSCLSIR